MPRVTRAAARADHNLADEIDAVAEIAIAEDAVSVPLPASPLKNTERKPLGETGGNASAPTPTEQHTPTQDDKPQDVSSEPVVIHMGDEENAALTGTITRKDGLTSGKKSTRKGKGTATDSLKGQFSERMGKWTQSMNVKPASPIKLDDKLAADSPGGSAKKSKRNRKKKGTQNGGDAAQETREIFEDERQATRSSASEEAVELLKENSTPDNNIIEDDRPASVSPVAEAISKLEHSPSEQEVVPTAAKLAVVKESPPALFGEQCSPMPAPEAEEGQKPEAVQKLESLFQLSEDEPREEKTPSPLASVLAHTPTGKGASPKKNPIEAIDALEDDIEAVKASLEMAASPPSSSSKTKRSSPVKRRNAKVTPVEKPSPIKRAKPTVSQSSVQASAVDRVKPQREVKARPSVVPRTESQPKPTGTAARPAEAAATPSKPTTVERARQRAAIAALRTPPAVAKSSKPVTKATFQLPGEAAAAKLKAMKEEREKRREEAENAAEENKSKLAAKPVSKPSTFRPSLAKAARPSIAPKSEASKDGSTIAPKRTSTFAPRPSPLASSSSTATTRAPRPSVVASKAAVPRVARMSTAASAAKASASPETQSKKPTATVTKATRPSAALTTKRSSTLNTANTYRQRFSSSGSSTSASNSKAASAKGKEVFSREKVAKEAHEKAAKDRIQAAKKAREEATMRGKAAAKAWAEKSKKKEAGARAPVTIAKKLEVQVEQVDEAGRENAEPAEEVLLAAPVVDGAMAGANASLVA